MIKSFIAPEVSKSLIVRRNIRSFVCRQGRLTFRQAKALQEVWPKMGVDFTGNLLSFDSLFCNNATVILEIGFGMGDSLISMAEKNPTKNFLGVEVYSPGIGACLASASSANLTNIRVICHDAIQVLEEMLPDNSLDIVQIFFPDPWYKTRHHKRRLVQKPFAELVVQKLVLGGIFHIATDWKPYADYMLHVMHEIISYRNLSITGDYVQRPSARPVTKFEKRGKRLGYEIFDMMFEKSTICAEARVKTIL